MEIIAAIAIGGLLGFFVGMSASPTVGAVATAICGSAMAFATFLPKKNAPIPTAQERTDAARRLTAFAAGCLVCALGGLLVRTHGLLSPSLSQRIHSWETTGLTREQARDIVIRTELGGGAVSDDAPGAKGQVHVTDSAFYTNRSAGLPKDLDPSAMEAAEISEAWSRAGSPWRQLASAFEPLPPTERAPMARRIWEALSATVLERKK